MNARRVSLLCGIAAGLALVVYTLAASPAAGYAPDNIIVTNADALRETTVSTNAGLTAALDSTAARVAVEFANTLRTQVLPALPAQLQAGLDQTTARISVEFANTVRRLDLPPLPIGLQIRLDGAAARVVFEFANSNRQQVLTYPAALLNDHTNPVISAVAVNASTGISTWTTDEFATSTVRYGTQPGVYTYTSEDLLYETQHQVRLLWAQNGQQYYYRVTSVDRSGNSSTSAEQSFVYTGQTFFQSRLVLPVILK